jgi:hypothetical protein
MTIFVSIASYRDKVCSSTLSSLYAEAENPFRVFVGICQQNNHSQDMDCVYGVDNGTPHFAQWVLSNVRILRIPYEQAQGPTFARYYCSLLYQKEDFFLQIDSHSLFVKNWDTKLVGMIEELKTKYHIPKPVLSHYCDVYENYSSEPNQHMVTTMTSFGMDDNKMIYFLGAEYLPTLSHPRRGAFISGQMFFCAGSFLEELPFDPFLPDLFFGEEILLTLRFYTNGWDIFTPHQNIIYHAYTREKEPKYWSDKAVEMSDSVYKVKYMLGMLPPQSFDPSRFQSKEVHDSISVYGMGKHRPVDDYWRWIEWNPLNPPLNFSSHRLPPSILDENLNTTLPSLSLPKELQELIEQQQQQKQQQQQQQIQPLLSSEMAEEEKSKKYSLDDFRNFFMLFLGILILIILICICIYLYPY